LFTEDIGKEISTRTQPIQQAIENLSKQQQPLIEIIRELPKKLDPLTQAIKDGSNIFSFFLISIVFFLLRF
jgi:hypothetical protein